MDASQALVTEHLPLARRIAAAMARRMPLPREEIESAAMLGLVQAARAFDQEKGNFASFASSRIRGAILDEARVGDELTRDQRRAFKTGTAGAIAPPRHVDIDDLAEAIPGGQSFVSVERWAVVEDLRRHLRWLPHRLQYVVRRHLLDEVLLKGVGKELGVSESRACQLLGEAIERLRVRLLPATDESHARPRFKHGQRFCHRGHELVGYNLVLTGPGRNRGCRKCKTDRTRRYRWAKGTRPAGVRNPGPHKLRRLTNDQAREVLARLHARERVAHVARHFGVADLVIRLIRDGRTYRDVPRPPCFIVREAPIGKLTRAQAAAIRRRLEAGERNCDLAAEYGVSQASICNIRRGRHHRGHMTDQVVLDDARHRRSPRAKLTDEQARDVKVSLAAKVPVAELARRYGLGWGTIRCIRDGRTYRHVGEAL